MLFLEKLQKKLHDRHKIGYFAPLDFDNDEELEVEIATDDIKTCSMDHHGLVAAVCKDLEIAKKIDDRMGKQDPRRILSAGTAVFEKNLNRKEASLKKLLWHLMYGVP